MFGIGPAFFFSPIDSEEIASGGNVFVDGDFKVHVIDETTVFHVYQPGQMFDRLMIAGGGAGGGYFGGGGGAGEYLYQTEIAIDIGSYTIVIGGGGVAGPEGEEGTNGGNTTGFGLTLLGGGHGAPGGDSFIHPAGDGGGGGGGASTTGASAPGEAIGTTGLGNDGGAGGPVSGNYNSGGGGGAGAVGGNSDDTMRGDGGDGFGGGLRDWLKALCGYLLKQRDEVLKLPLGVAQDNAKGFQLVLFVSGSGDDLGEGLELLNRRQLHAKHRRRRRN